MCIVISLRNVHISNKNYFTFYILDKEHYKRKTATPSVLNEIQHLKEKISIIDETDHRTDAKVHLLIKQYDHLKITFANHQHIIIK